MAPKRASMREGPLAELFRATEAAQRAQAAQGDTGEADPESTPEAVASEDAPTQLQLERAEPIAPDRPTEPRTPDTELDATVEHVYDFEVGRQEQPTIARDPQPVVDTPPPPRSVEPEPVAETVPTLTPVPEPTPAAEPEPLHVAEARAEPVREERAEPYTPPASRFVAPMPESAPRLHVAGDVASYLAVIRVVGVGGAGINAVN